MLVQDAIAIAFRGAISSQSAARLVGHAAMSTMISRYGPSTPHVVPSFATSSLCSPLSYFRVARLSFSRFSLIMDIAAGAVRLPNELWDLVLENLEHEPVVLWLTCRQVCRGFRDAVELAFRRNVLSKALVEYKAATPIRLTFAGFSDDGKNAILRDAEPESHYTREFWNLRDIISQWKWTVGGYTGHSLDRSPQEAQPPRFDQPLYTIHLVGRVNDTVLPGLHIDFAERLIEFDWKAMFDRFYHEEAAILDRKLYLV